MKRGVSDCHCKLACNSRRPSGRDVPAVAELNRLIDLPWPVLSRGMYSFPNLLKGVRFFTVFTHEYVAGNSIKLGRNRLSVGGVADTGLIPTTDSIKIVDTRRGMKPQLFHHPPVLNNIKGAAGGYRGQLFHLFCIKPRKAGPKNNALNTVLGHMAGSDPLAAFPIYFQYRNNTGHVFANLPFVVTAADMVNYNSVGYRIYPFSVLLHRYRLVYLDLFQKSFIINCFLEKGFCGVEITAYLPGN